MKKMVFALAALLCSLAAQAQTPAANAQRADKPAKIEMDERQHDELKRKDQDERNAEKATPSANHGQTVQAVAQGTTLTGSAKGAAVSAAARSDRSAQAPRVTRTARGSHDHGSRAVGSSHSGSHGGGNGRRSEH